MYIFALLISILGAGLIYYSVSRSSHSGIKDPVNSSTTQTQSSPVNTPTNSYGSVVNNSKSLEDCLSRVSNSEAQQTIIDQSRQDCRKKYQ